MQPRVATSPGLVHQTASLPCPEPARLARKFLYVFAFLIALVIAGAFAYRLYGVEILRMALVPSEAFRAQPRVDPKRYADRAMWIARPDIPANPAL